MQTRARQEHGEIDKMIAYGRIYKMKKLYPSTISLLYPIVAMIYIATKTSEVPAIFGYGLSQLGYVMFFAGVYKGTFLVFNLDKRRQVLSVAIILIVSGLVLFNAN